ncbi:MAG: phosphoribosyltransferase family protein [Candidatus Nomurabacteria bacterium]|nr:phosphoribosyltransferase family protein [Candidatus Nomurabacteria bacterium]
MKKISKISLIREIIKLDIFRVANTTDKNKWILLKNGSRTPIFLDTSVFISHPLLLEKINKYIIQIIVEEKIKFNRIMGLPYGGIPFTYGVTNILKVPALALRKEGKKNYSTKGDLLGEFKKGDRVLLIEDAIVTANTAIGFIERIRKDNLIVQDLISIVDIGSIGGKNLKEVGVRLHSLFIWKELFNVYKSINPNKNKNIYKMIDDILS